MKQLVSLYGSEDKKIELRVYGNPVIYIDERELHSGISNIIKNAIEWAKSTVILKAYEKDGNLIIEIEDDGEGIKEEDREKIFEPFYTKRKSGTGLGLAIAKRVFVENGGNITVEESDLGGAKFLIQIPLVRER